MHPKVGDDEIEMSNFTTAAQAHVASEFNIDLICSVLAPLLDAAKLFHYARHNRCLKGNLSVEVPDVNLSTLSGMQLHCGLQRTTESAGRLVTKGSVDKPMPIFEIVD